MKPIVRHASACVVALSFVAVSSAARAAEPPNDGAASCFPRLTLTGQSLSPAPGASLDAPFAPTVEQPALLALLTSPAAAHRSPGDGTKALPMQLDGGEFNYRSIVLSFPDGEPAATVFVFNTAVGNFVTGKEYWYVNVDALGSLGSQALTISVTDSSSINAPSEPSYLPEQKFTQVQSPGWGTSWTSDPVSGGDLYSGPNNTAVRFVLSTGSPALVSRVVWYQVLSTGTPANIDPSGTWSVSLGGSVIVPSGSVGYDVNQSTG
jgi:hypothetical protein